jgi:hypothetical protein
MNMNKKFTLITVALFFWSAMNATVDITSIWQISHAQNNLDKAKDFSGIEGLGENLNRGLAYGKFGDKEYIFITTGSNTDGNAVNYYDAITGNWAGKLSMEPINSATFGSIHKIADIEVIDGKIYSVSLSVAGNSVDFCMWDGIDATPVISSLPSPTDIRVEKLSVSGNIGAGTGKIWIAGATEGLANPNPENPVYIRSFALGKDGAISTTATEFGQIPDNNILYNCTVNPDGSVLVKGGHKPLHLLARDGSYIGSTQNMTPELTLSQTIRYIGTNPHNGRYYYLLNSYSNTSGIFPGNGNVAKIYSMLPGNLNSFNCVAQCPTLGNLSGNMGDVDFKWEGNDLYIYNLSSNNGFGAFKVTGLFDKPANRSNDRFTLLWENSVEGNNLPGFYSDLENDQDKTTGLAYGIVGGEKCVYIVKNLYIDPDQPKNGEDIWGPSGDYRKNIFIYNAENGDIKGELSINGIWGGEMQDATVTEDGILMTAFAVPEGETMNVFSFPDNAHEGSLNDITFAYDSECPALLGGNIFALGNVSKGTGKIYATTQSETENYVSTFGMAGANKWEGFYTEEEFTIPSPGKGYLAVKPDRSFYWNASGEKFLYCDGKEISDSQSTLEGTAIRYILTHEGLDYLAVLNQNKVDVYTLKPGQPDTKVLWGSSPVLGDKPSSTGDIEVGFDEDGSPVLYVLSANNGFAAWKLSSLTITGNEKVTEHFQIDVYFNSSSKNLFFSKTVKTVHLFTIDGKLIQSAINVNTVNIDAKGVVIVYYTDGKGFQGAKKVVLR